MLTNAAAQIQHLQERLARQEIAFRKLKAQVGNLNQANQIANGSPGGMSGISFTVIRCATTLAQVSAKTSGQAGSGTVQCADVDPTSGAITNAETLPVYNFFATTIAGSVDVFIGWAPNLTLGGGKGCWVIIQKYC